VSRRRLSASLSFGFRNPPVTVLSKTAILVQVQQIVASLARIREHGLSAKETARPRKMTMLSAPRAAFLWFDGAFKF